MMSYDLFLHFEACPDEGPDPFGIVIAYGFAEIVEEGSVSFAVFFHVGSRFQHRGAESGPQPSYGAAVGERDGLVGIDPDECVPSRCGASIT